MKPRFGSVFSGIGGFDLGFERAGWECAWQIENDPFCRRVLERHWPAVPKWGDLRAVRGAELPEVDLVCGGWPCQDLSVAGRRAGLAGARSGLFWELVRLIKELREASGGTRPTTVVGENVPGLLSSDGGRDFAAVLHGLADSGCVEVGWRVLDSRFFGVPQRRRRVFLVGRLGGPCPLEVLFEPEGVPGHPAPGGEAGAGVAYPVAAGAGGSKFGSGRDSQDTFVTAEPEPYGFHAQGGSMDLCAQPGSVPSLKLGAGGNAGHQTAIAFDHTQDPVSSASVRPTLNEDGQAVAVTSGPKMWDDRGIHRGTVSRDVTPTLNGFEQPMVLPAVRRLTPTECERLQAFPDGWTCLCGVEPYTTADCRCPDGPRYSALGNAVTCSVVEWLGRRLLAAHLEGTSPSPDQTPPAPGGRGGTR
jgi:DNA (cytosine-5)-methyltransferase 1